VKENYSPSKHGKNILGAVRLWLCVLVVALALPLASRAQDTGYISGTVTDKSGAAVVGAEVVVSGAGANLGHNTTTNSDGAYVVAGLPGGTYDILITAKGFQKYQAKGVKLDVAQKIRVDVTLTVGAVTEIVEVTGESVAQVETTSSELGGTITGKQVQQLELNGRNFTQLATLSPGVMNQGPDEAEVGVTNIFFSVNGGRQEYNNWEVDGGDNMDNGSNATLNVFPNLEAIAEFKVLTSNYGAQYGRNGSGTVEVETKSGANTFHGSAFYYGRNEDFNARSWVQGTTNSPRALYRKHDYGYTLGGPVFIPNHYNTAKKKTFFFWSEEWRKEANPSTITQDVPSDAERGLVGGTQTAFGNFTDVCAPPATADCPNVTDVTKVPISAVGQDLLALIPRSTFTNGLLSNGQPISAVQQTISPSTTWREELIRVDHNLTDNYRVTMRFIHDSWQTVIPNPLWGNGNSNFQSINTNFVGPGTGFVARLNANITPTLLNEFVASYTASHIHLTALNDPPLPSPFPMGALFANGFGGKLPSIQLGNNAAYGGSFGQDTGYFPWHNTNPTYTYRDNMTKVFGTHTFQFGAYLVFAQKNEANSPDLQGIVTFSTSSQFTTGNAFADLLEGNIGTYKQWSKETQYYDRYRIVEPYFQDDWRVTKRLTLNLGLRFSLFGTYRERYHQAFNFNPSAFLASHSPAIDPNTGALIPSTTQNPFNGLVQCGASGGNQAVPAAILAATAFPAATVGASSNAGCLQGHLFNPAPRIGFAYDPKGDGKMAIRGGYGIFYEHTNGNEGNTESLEGSPPLVLTSSQNNIQGYANIGAGGGLLFPQTVNSIPNKAVWPYVQQWNLSVQKELPAHFIFSAAYVGSKGTHLTLLNNLNQIVPASANPYTAGQPITAADCTSFAANGTLANGKPAPINLGVACGANPDLFRNGATNFPGFSNINSLRDVANSSYHSLQLGAQRTVGDLTLSIAYTYSHSIDDASDRSDTAFVNAYNIAANRANSTFDLRHNASISYVYALPFFRGSGLRNSLLGGWQISGITVAQTGLPFTVTNGTTFADNAGVGNGVGTGSRPDQVGNAYAVTAAQKAAASGVIGPLAYNPAAFAVPTGLTFGNVGRDTLYLPGRLNFDAGIFKQFRIKENMGFQFRAETFNTFNHTQFDAVGGNSVIGSPGGTHTAMDTSDPGSATSLGTSSFLHLTGTHNPRIMQLGLRFYF
jgi:hypothetical protein